MRPRPDRPGPLSGVLLGCLAAGLIAAVWLTGPGALAQARGPSLRQAPQVVTDSRLSGVAATSARNAWAVGASFGASGSSAVILHWNGRVWRQVRCPGASTVVLAAVAAASARDAWAVGGTAAGKTFVVRWNGRSWRPVPSPSPGTGDSLGAVTATSADNAWAIGATAHARPLIEHWNGRSWRAVPPPAGLSGASLASVAATSARNAWAVGTSGSGKPLILTGN